ncbi:hypothetical protein ES703_69866 [subsurface metagenome]
MTHQNGRRVRSPGRRISRALRKNKKQQLKELKARINAEIQDPNVRISIASKILDESVLYDGE